jgi:hypothetical protein
MRKVTRRSKRAVVDVSHAWRRRAVPLDDGLVPPQEIWRADHGAVARVEVSAEFRRLDSALLHLEMERRVVDLKKSTASLLFPAPHRQRSSRRRNRNLRRETAAAKRTGRSVNHTE